MNNSFLEKIDGTFTIDEIKNFMRIAYKSNLSEGDVLKCYDEMNSIVNNTGEIKNYNELAISVFKGYWHNLLRYGRDKLNDPKLISDFDLIANSTVLQNSNNIKEIFSSEDFLKLNYKPIFPQDGNVNSRFTHIRASMLNNFLEEDLECRFYISPKMENLGELVKEIINRHLNKGLPCYLKINTDSTKNDRIVFYSSLQNANDHLEIFKEIKQERKELFAESNKNPMWGKIREVEDIYFGMEPYVRYQSSYGVNRINLLESTLINYQHLYGEIDPENISDEQAKIYYDMLRKYSLLHNVDPNNFALNKNKEFSDEDKPFIELDYENEKIPIYIVTYDYANNVVQATFDSMGMHGAWINFTIEELDLLYKRNTQEMDYQTSETYRKQVFDAIKKTKLKTKINEMLDKINPVVRYRQKRIVQRAFDGKAFVGGGKINYNLYMVLPRKVSELLVKLQKKKENTQENIIDVALDEEIDGISEEITTFSSEEIKATIQTLTFEERQRLEEIYIEEYTGGIKR